MNVKYIYRVDTLQNLKRINDFSFRGKIWDNAPDDYPHGMLKLFHDIKKSDEKIYIICFYSSLKNALANEFNAIHSNKKSKYILRCPVNALDLLALNGFGMTDSKYLPHTYFGPKRY